MLIVFAVLLLSSQRMASPASATEFRQPPCSITISAPQTVKSKAPITIVVRLTNTSGRIQTLVNSTPACDYKAEIRDSNGGLAPKISGKLRERCLGRTGKEPSAPIALEPNEWIEDSVDISSLLYDVTRPDTYTVQLSRDFPILLGTISLKSNKIKIIVTN